MSIAIRNSRQRRLVLEAVQAHKGHPSAEAVYAMLKAEHPTLSLGTVYRNLAILTKLGLIRKVGTDLTSEHYDGTCTPHFHLLCDVCGGIEDIHAPEAQQLLEVAAQAACGHRIDGMNVLFSGRCARCIAKEDKKDQ